MCARSRYRYAFSLIPRGRALCSSAFCAARTQILHPRRRFSLDRRSKGVLAPMGSSLQIRASAVAYARGAARKLVPLGNGQEELVGPPGLEPGTKAL